MPEFTYEALDKGGQPTTGSITARDTTEAALKVRSLGVYPTQIGPRRGEVATNPSAGTALVRKSIPAKAAGPAARGGKRITRVQVLLFTRAIGDLLDAGLPMDRAFSVLTEQTDSGPVRAMLASMQADIRAGHALSEALSKFPAQFPPLYTNMVRAGEVSGQLAEVLTRLATFMEKEQVRRGQIMAALTYPMVLVTVATLAVTFLLTYVIPKLADVFKEMGAALPLPTQILIGASTVIGHWWWLILGGIAGGYAAFSSWIGTTAGRRSFDGFRLRLPIFGGITEKTVAARFVRTLGTLLGGGVSILDAMEITSTAVGNAVAAEAVLIARNGVRQGETLHESLEKAGGFLPVVRHMTAVGEETGRLGPMLIRTADTLDFEVDTALRRITSLVEPLVVVFMGGFVAFVVLSILLPIFQANTIVK